MRVNLGNAGFSGERLKSLTQSMEAYVERGEVAGAVALVFRHGEIAHLEIVGFQDEEAKIPLKRDTVFRIASMTKPIVSVAILMLVEEAKLRLNDPVDKWLPELANLKVLRNPGGALNDCYPSSRSITILDLLTHTSGLSYPFTAEGPLVKALERIGNFLSDLPPDEWIMRLGELPLSFEPGARWNYGLSFEVLGVLLARASGSALPDFLFTRIFEPLGMKDTAFWVPQDKLNRLAVSYAVSPKTGKREVQDHPSHTKLTSPPIFPSGGGGLVSTVNDYLKFSRMLLGKGKLDDLRILSRKSVELMTSNFLTAEQRRISSFLGKHIFAGQGFGLGVSVVDDVTKQDSLSSVGQFGWSSAYGTWFSVDPREDMISILMIQLFFANSISNIRPDFETLVYQAIDD